MPLLATVFYTINAALTTMAKVRVTLRALSATPADATGTLYALHRLLAPIEKILKSLHVYLEEYEIQAEDDLPGHYADQATKLIADTKFAIPKLDSVDRNLLENARSRNVS